jgi:spore coat-associated protein N
MRPIATLVISIAMALGAIGLAVAAPGGLIAADTEVASAEVQAAGGAVGIVNSHDGQAVFSVAGMRPGDVLPGTVTIGNDGDLPGRFSVLATGVTDVVGPNQGKLSERLELALFDVTNPGNPIPKFAGVPKDFGPVDLGVIAPGQERDYRIVATLPDGDEPDTDNRFQGSSLSLGFAWSATNFVATPTPTPATPAPTTPTPATPAPTTPAPTTPPPTPTAPVALADAIGLPATTSCVKGGKLTLRLKAPAGTKVVAVTVKVNGKTKARLKGAKASKAVSLRKLKGTTKLAVSIKASDKRTYSAARSYKACKR